MAQRTQATDHRIVEVDLKKVTGDKDIDMVEIAFSEGWEAIGVQRRGNGMIVQLCKTTRILN